MATSTYIVKGMTCAHCVSSVTEEVGAVPGVAGVQVDLATGQMDVIADDAIDDGAIAAAVAEAGYQVVSAR